LPRGYGSSGARPRRRIVKRVPAVNRDLFYFLPTQRVLNTIDTQVAFNTIETYEPLWMYGFAGLGEEIDEWEYDNRSHSRRAILFRAFPDDDDYQAMFRLLRGREFPYVG